MRLYVQLNCKIQDSHSTLELLSQNQELGHIYFSWEVYFTLFVMDRELYYGKFLVFIVSFLSCHDTEIKKKRKLKFQKFTLTENYIWHTYDIHMNG